MKTVITRILVSIIAIFVLVVIYPSQTLAQDSTKVEATKAKKKADKPVRSPWNAGMLIETQTDLVWAPKTLEFVIQHRFGNLGSGTFDLAGLYAPSNIRIGFNYGLFKNAQIGFGTTKDSKLQDVNWKYKILTQTKSNSMPVALTYYGNIQINGSPSNSFGTEYRFANRVSYFNQLIISRKFTKKLTMQATINYAHFNLIDTAAAGMSELKHSNFGFGVAGRYKVGSNTAIIFEYDQALTTPEKIKSNLSLGVEMGTSAHIFHVFVSTYKGISYQNNMVYNQNDFTQFNDDGWGILIGFNMTRNWNF